MPKRKKGRGVASDNGNQEASDPLAFVQADKLSVMRVRSALRALDKNANVRARDLRAFINKVRKAVTGSAPAESAEPTAAA